MCRKPDAWGEMASVTVALPPTGRSPRSAESVPWLTTGAVGWEDEAEIKVTSEGSGSVSMASGSSVGPGLVTEIV